MKNYCGLSVVFVLMAVLLVSGLAMAQLAGPSDQMIKNAFQQIKASADGDKDGKVTVSECKAIYKDKQKGEKNCIFWDADKDGTITEEEYVSQVKKLGKK
jgi:hypothetical protein